MTAEHPDELQRAIGNLFEAIEICVKTSDSRMQIEHTGRQNRALAVFAKLIAHCMTTGSCVSDFSEPSAEGFLDHFSVASLGRAAVDAAMMTMYISHPSLTADTWNLRRHVLFLHDLLNRKRFLEAMQKSGHTIPIPFFDGYEETKRDLRDKIRTYGQACRLPEDRIEELQKGQLVFVDGARGAWREAGWNVDYFDFVQSYFSAYVHSHPVSFLRALGTGISFQKPSQFQRDFCALVLETVAGHALEVNERMQQFTGAMERDPLGHIE